MARRRKNQIEVYRPGNIFRVVPLSTVFAYLINRPDTLKIGHTHFVQKGANLPWTHLEQKKTHTPVSAMQSSDAHTTVSSISNRVEGGPTTVSEIYCE